MKRYSGGQVDQGEVLNNYCRHITSISRALRSENHVITVI